MKLVSYAQPHLISIVFLHVISPNYILLKLQETIWKWNLFLDSLNFPTLSDAQFSFLEAPITLKELEDALISMPKGKSPGLDGIPPELLSVLWDLIGPIVFDSFNFSLKIGYFHRDQKNALISLLLKKRQGPS